MIKILLNLVEWRLILVFRSVIRRGHNGQSTGQKDLRATSGIAGDTMKTNILYKWKGETWNRVVHHVFSLARLWRRTSSSFPRYSRTGTPSSLIMYKISLLCFLQYTSVLSLVSGFVSFSYQERNQCLQVLRKWTVASCFIFFSFFSPPFFFLLLLISLSIFK